MLPDIDLQNSALIVIDMQADFYAENGSAARRGNQVTSMRNTAHAINTFLQHSSHLFPPIIFTRYVSGDTVTPDNLKYVAKKCHYDLMCKIGSGLEDFSIVSVPDDAVIIDKPHFDAFAYANLLQLLKENGITSVFIAGVRTEICVDATAKRAASEGFVATILQDLVATYDDEIKRHQETLDFFDKYYGFIADSAEIS